MADRKVVVVDGSNLATEGRTIPSLRQLDEAVRAYAEEDPQAEIVVVVDASFEHRIDPSERAQLVEAELHGEVVSPPAGAIGRGDAFVLRIAERTGARVLSNDSFQEFHAEHPWLFDEGRLVGGKPVPGVGWIFTPRIPVRGPKSRQATGKAKRAQATGETLSPPVKAAELARAAKKVAARKVATLPDGSLPKIGDVWPGLGTNGARLESQERAEHVEPTAAASPRALADGVAAGATAGKKAKGKGKKESKGAKEPPATDHAQAGAGSAEVAGPDVAEVAVETPAAEPLAAATSAAAAWPTTASPAAETPAAASVRAPAKRPAKKVAKKAIKNVAEGVGAEGVTDEPAEEPASLLAEATKAPAKKAAAKAPAKKAATKEAAPKKAAVKEVVAKEASAAAEAPTKNVAATKKAPAKKVAAKKAPAKKVAAKKSVAEKAAAAPAGGTAKKAPAKKAPAKKAPAKKVAAKAVATKKTVAKRAASTKAAAVTAAAAAAATTAESLVAPQPSGVVPTDGEVAGEEAAASARSRALQDPVLADAIDQAMAEVLSPPADGKASADEDEAGTKKKDTKGGKRRRRRSPSPPPAVNEPLAFITFVASYPLRSELEGEVVSFTSHGAMVDVGLPGGGTLHCYIPLTAMGDPPPTKARQVLARGERRPFVLVGLDPPRRVAELALPDGVEAQSAAG